jgi:hypothetical protein
MGVDAKVVVLPIAKSPNPKMFAKAPMIGICLLYFIFVDEYAIGNV